MGEARTVKHCMLRVVERMKWAYLEYMSHKVVGLEHGSAFKSVQRKLLVIGMHIINRSAHATNKNFAVPSPQLPDSGFGCWLWMRWTGFTRAWVSLHCSLLATFTWTALEGFTFYFSTCNVTVFNIYIRRYLLGKGRVHPAQVTSSLLIQIQLT